MSISSGRFTEKIYVTYTVINQLYQYYSDRIAIETIFNNSFFKY